MSDILTTAQSRRAAYQSIMSNLGAAQRAVYMTLRTSGPTCERLLAARMVWPANRVTGRVKELRDLGLVVLHGQMLDPQTRRRVTTWRALPEPESKQDRQLSML